MARFTHSTIIQLLFTTLVYSVHPFVLAQDLILSAPPRENAQQGRKIYQPFADSLTKVLGRKVIYQHPHGWLAYQRDMRKGRYDLVFDGPHFASWRLAHLQHQTVVKLPGSLTFYLLTSHQYRDINNSTDLIGRKICGISPPNLSTLSILDLFNNPARQPLLVGVRGGMGKVFEKFIRGKCNAAVLRTAFYNKRLTPQQRQNMRILYTTKNFPAQTLTVGNKISSAEIARLKREITTGMASKAGRTIVKKFTGKSQNFIAARNSDYQTQRQLLEGVIYGW